MLEIIPNWHPIFVHFTIGLFGAATLFYCVGWMLQKEILLSVGKWNLWLGTLLTIGTVLVGLDAYNTVAHDAASHAAMTDHKNWALTTSAVFLVLALWSLYQHRKKTHVTIVFLIALLAAAGLLAVTGYKGGEVVYRHGIGVMKIPASINDNHHQAQDSDAHGNTHIPASDGHNHQH